MLYVLIINFIVFIIYMFYEIASFFNKVEEILYDVKFKDKFLFNFKSQFGLINPTDLSGIDENKIVEIRKLKNRMKNRVALAILLCGIIAISITYISNKYLNYNF